MTVPLIAARLSHFCLGKSNQNRVSRNASLPHRALAHKSGKTTGRNLFAGLTFCFITMHAKSCYASCQFTGQPFFRISPEAILLTEESVVNILCYFDGLISSDYLTNFLLGADK